MENRIKHHNLLVSNFLDEFVKTEMLKGLNITPNHFWKTLSIIVNKFTPINKNLLAKRKDMQFRIDKWHKDNKYNKSDINEYKKFLKEIGYIENEVESFKINTTNVDKEITKISGPQLVVPITNARFSINAANARWGSLYDSLYGTDVISTENNADQKKLITQFVEKKLYHLQKIF